MTAEQSNRVPLTSIFIGGGTPTALNANQLTYLLTSLERTFPQRAATIEMTVEANPGTVDADKLAALRAGGVNRISFGAQTFQDTLLKDIGRIHSPQDVTRSIDLARQAGFENLSIDLMFGLPGQTVEMVRHSVDCALAFALPHLSLYGLKIEENTLFHTLYARNELVLPDEDDELAMYEYIMEQLIRHGYEHYEVSNFAKPGFASRHNLAYWRNRAYYGVGAGAHGYVHGQRHVNIKGVQAYIDATQRGLPILEQHAVSVEEAMEDFMMVGLRMLTGVNRTEFEHQFGVAWDERFATTLAQLERRGLLQADDYGYRLSRQGLLLGNEVFAAFLEK